MGEGVEDVFEYEPWRAKKKVGSMRRLDIDAFAVVLAAADQHGAARQAHLAGGDRLLNPRQHFSVAQRRNA